MKKKYLRVLHEIQESIPKELLERLMKKEIIGSTVKEVIERALKEPDDVVSQDEKQRFQAMIDSGYLDTEIEVIDTDVDKQIDALVGAAIAKAVADGRLPAEAPKLKLLNNKGKKYVRRQAARLEKLFSPEGDSEGSNGGDDSQHAETDSARADNE